jgi:hypothetical protein
VLSSSNSGSLVNFSAGTKDVFVDYPAGRAVYEDAAGNVDGYPITGGTINNTVIGGTTPAAGTFTTLIGGGGSANYFQTQGSATTKAVEAKALGSDTNIAFVIDSKGTGAIDLAAGSSGVNISNGGTVTAITRTAAGGGYTGIPAVAVSAPTTAGGVQATVTTSIGINSATIANGGTGYSVNDVVTLVGGTFVTVASQFTVTSVSGGVVTGITASVGANYTVFPTQPAATTGGTGTGLTLSNLSGFVPSNGFTITNAGSGYVEQPTVTFSGGGGSGAAAYATVGSDVTVKSVGSSIILANPAGTMAKFASTSSGSLISYPEFTGSQFATVAYYGVNGTGSNIGLQIGSKGTGSLTFQTSNATQFNIVNTASAVNYVQVTGAATGSSIGPSFAAAGSDAAVPLTFTTKSTGAHRFVTGAGLAVTFVDSGGTTANFLQIQGRQAGNGPIISAQGSDPNVDINFTPKGTGNMRFGTYTGTISAITGYIEIKDSGGTVRRLAVVA